jgi:hypothetical protein
MTNTTAAITAAAKIGYQMESSDEFRDVFVHG